MDLEVLKVTNQQLARLDPELGLFGGLKIIDFRDNKLIKVPSSFSNLLQLSTLVLSYNNFTSFPSVLTVLPNLHHLDLSNNSLEALNLTIPPIKPLFPGTPPPLVTSPPPLREPPSKPCPALKTLILDGNRISIHGLPAVWPPCLATLQLTGNPLFLAGEEEELGLKAFEGARTLRVLRVADTGLTGVKTEGRDLFDRLEILDLKGNKSLNGVDGLKDRWADEKEVEFRSTESGERLEEREAGEKTKRKLEILVDPRLVPKTPGRKKTHVYVDDSPEVPVPTPTLQPRPSPPPRLLSQPIASTEPSSQIKGNEEPNDPFWLPLSSPNPSTSKLTASLLKPTKPAPPKPLAFDTWDEAPSTTSSTRTSTPKLSPVQTPSLPLSPASSFEQAIFDKSYSPTLQKFTLSAKGRSVDPVLPNGAFDFQQFANQPYASSVRAVVLEGKNLKAFSGLPSSADASTSVQFPSVKTLSITSTSVPLSTLIPFLPDMFPALEELDLSETILGDALFANEGVLRGLLLREGAGLRSLRVREAGVKCLEGLECLGRAIREGEGGWRCVEIDVRDNSIDKLDPTLGFLPLETFLVDRNLFRSPSRRIWEREGTEGLLSWLRNQV